MNWNQPKCVSCWNAENPDRQAAAILPEYAEPERCSSCGELTRSGIYVRQHPDKVRYPKVDE